MNLPVLKRDVPQREQPGRASGTLAKKLLRKRVLLPAAACVLAGAFALRLAGGGQPASAAGLTYTTAPVERRDITAQITGSGTLEAANSYSVTSLAEGSILTADFEEGDQVEEGTVLYTIDTSDLSGSLEQARISLEQAQRSYNSRVKDLEKLSVTAPKTGRVLSLEVEEGDDVSAGQTVATLRNSDVMTLTVPFLADEAAGFSVGQRAAVTLESTFETLEGTVSKVDRADTVLEGNRIVRYVTVEVANPGALSVSQTGSATIDGCASAGSAAFAYAAEQAITAEVSGQVAAIRAREGDRVDRGDVLLTLTSDSLDDSLQSAADSLRNAELSLESRQDQLNNYTITSPIRGTVIDKNYKAGETSEAGKVLCSIYDLSYLTMTLSVDELDISDIAVGQRVEITADAVEGKTYTGVVTKVSVAGTSSGGTTTYPVTVRIDETEGLLPGMNVDAAITLQSASGVLAIPSGALNRGNTVLVTADSPSAANGTAIEGGDYCSVPVEIGASDSSYIEIISGLQEGDTVAYIPTTSSGGFGMMMPGGMGGVAFEEIGRAEPCPAAGWPTSQCPAAPAAEVPAAGGEGPDMALITFQDVCKYYPMGDSTVTAADHISFEIETGEFTAIVGSSGSGKSTCMNIIGCLDVPSEGTYLLNGQDVGRMNKNRLAEIRNELLGFIFQQYNLLPRLNLLENVEVPLMYAGVPRGERRERALAALEQVGLGDKWRHRPMELSGGQQQRVSIARALVGRPSVILADEPTGALDSRTGREVLAMLQDLHRAGHTVVLITHDNSIAVQAQRIIRLEDGRVVYDGPADAPEAVVTPRTPGKRGGGDI